MIVSIKFGWPAGYNFRSEKLALAFNNRGFLKYKAVDFDGAITDYTKSLKLNTSSYNRGTVLYRLSMWSSVELSWEK